MSAVQGPIAELIAQRMLSAPLRPGVLALLDRFEILRELGRGGMGIVLLGRDPGTAQEVAIKLVRSDLAAEPRAVQRFVKEAGHLKRLRHANVVPVLEIADRPRFPYFVMPYFEKGSLASRLKPGEPLDRETILELALAVAEGLNFAHRRGIIHRDLKPANLLLRPEGGVCLADFGLARSLFNDTLVELEGRQGEGTAAYMSPAVAAGEAEDTRCDIYSFGALLYEMLTGSPPYQGRSAKEILDQIRAGPPRPITSVNPRADRGLAAIASGALARELRERYAEMGDILADLHRVGQGRPPLGPHGAGHKARPLASRPGRVARVLGVAVCLAVAAALGWRLWRTPGPARGPVPPPGPPPQAQPEKPIPTRTEKPPAEPAPSGAPAAPPSSPQPVLAFQTPWGIAADGQGNVFVTDSDKAMVWKILPTGAMTNLAGWPGDPGNVQGLGSAARFVRPRGIALDKAGNMYVADGHHLRAVTPAGDASLFPERGADPAGETTFDLPSGIAVDGQGNVFVADRYTIKKITPAGEVALVAGKEHRAGIMESGPGGKALFSDMEKGLALDAAGNLYVGDMVNNMIRKITPEGQVAVLAGSREPGSTNGPGRKAGFFRPCGLAVDRAGTVYVADSGNHTIRAITPQGMVSTFAGTAGQRGLADGPSTDALFDTPTGVAVDAAGNVYVADTGNHLVRKIMPAGRVISLGRPGQPPAGTPGGPGPEPGAALALPDMVQRCVHLARAGVGEQVILAFLRQDTNGPYTLTDNEIIYLENQGVSEDVISALLPKPKK